MMMLIRSPQLRRPLLDRLLLGAVLVMCSGLHAHAQTLAQKNWAGSGVTVEPWWRRGVIYRIDPERFQDSTGSGHGDLAGIAQRLEYVQSLGVDAILLAPAPGAAALTPELVGATFDELARGAVDHHLRLLVELPAPESQAPAADAKLLNLARYWLNQGVAGFYIPTQALAKVDGGEHVAALLRQLHGLVTGFPGERILIAQAPLPNADAAVVRALAQSVQLTAAAAFSATTAPGLRAQLSAAIADSTSLLSADRVSAQATRTQQDVLSRTHAAMLLASRGAVLLDYGEELGLISAGEPPLMQWTPANLTRKPQAVAASATSVDEAGDTSFKPFVPPLPRDLFKPPAMPEIFATDHPVNASREPDLQPGFTSGELPQPSPVNAAAANVALEDANPASLLNFYRRLIQMHHDDAALRNGTQTVEDHDAVEALVWTRPSPPNARSASTDVVVCNLSARPLTLTLETLHVRMGSLRTLLGSTPVRSGDSVTLAAYGVFMGEAGR